MRTFAQWLSRKWPRREVADLAESYRATFDTFHGKRVLDHWLNHVYCQIYEGKDPIEMAMHNGRRSFVHEVLEALDVAEHPEKYGVDEETEEK